MIELTGLQRLLTLSRHGALSRFESFRSFDPPDLRNVGLHDPTIRRKYPLICEMMGYLTQASKQSMLIVLDKRLTNVCHETSMHSGQGRN